MGNERNTDKPYRDADILIEYERIIGKYGELSKEMRKRTLYEEVAKKFYLHWETAARIIRKQIKPTIT